MEGQARRFPRLPPASLAPSTSPSPLQRPSRSTSALSRPFAETLTPMKHRSSFGLAALFLALISLVTLKIYFKNLRMESPGRASASAQDGAPCRRQRLSPDAGQLRLNKQTIHAMLEQIQQTLENLEGADQQSEADAGEGSDMTEAEEASASDHNVGELCELIKSKVDSPAFLEKFGNMRMSVCQETPVLQLNSITMHLGMLLPLLIYGNINLLKRGMTLTKITMFLSIEKT